MKKSVWMGWASVVVAGVSLACSGSSGGGSNPFPFSGPSCPAGQLPGMQPGSTTSQACTQCLESKCSTEVQCIAADCNALFSCSCACQQGDFQCQARCLQNDITTACTTCLTNTVVQCEFQKCNVECGGYVLDGGND